MINLKHYNIGIVPNKTSYDGNLSQIKEVTRNDGKKINRDEMIEISSLFKKSLTKLYKHGIVSVSIKYPDRYYSANVSSLHDDINFFTSDDYDVFSEDPLEYKSFRFNFIPITKKATGGNDEMNDCLVNCIKKVIQTHKDKIDAGELKESLGLNREDKIPLDKLSLVEKYIQTKTQMEYAIHISGDFEFISSLQTNKVIRLILSDEHYSLDTSNMYQPKRRSFEEKSIVMSCYDDGVYNCFDGTGYFTLTFDEAKEINNNPMSSEYFLVDIKTLPMKKPTIEEAFKFYIDMAEDMKQATEGRINFYKCGSIKQMALNLFYQNNKAVQPQNISNIEASWINKASFSALTYWEKYEGNVATYDVNSHYPYQLS